MFTSLVLIGLLIVYCGTTYPTRLAQVAEVATSPNNRAFCTERTAQVAATGSLAFVGLGAAAIGFYESASLSPGMALAMLALAGVAGAIAVWRRPALEAGAQRPGTPDWGPKAGFALVVAQSGVWLLTGLLALARGV